MEEAINEKRKEKRGFSHRKKKRWNKGWVHIACFQLSCFGSNETDDGVIVLEELKGDEKEEEVRKIGKLLRFRMRKPERTVPVGVGQTGEIEIEMVDGENPLQAEVEAVKKPLRATNGGDVEDSKFRRLLHVLSPKAHKKKTSKTTKNGSYPQPPKVQVIGGTHVSTSPRPVPTLSPKPDSGRSQTTNSLLPSTPKGKPPLSCPIFSSAGCRKLEGAAESTAEISMRSTDERKTEVVVIRKSDLRIIGFVGCVVLILATLVGGRTFAIICTSVLLYFAPLLRALSSPTMEIIIGDSKPKKDNLGIDCDSEEYKKRVVLEGQLERTGRRPAGVLH